jgi:2-octaprenyl-6-methoxyphenol hydroxylase
MINMRAHVEVLVVGGGPVGCALAVALRELPIDVAVLEASTARESDNRTLAVSYGSRLILDRLGVWKTLTEVAPIDTIHVSQQGDFGRTLLTAAEARVPALGYTLGYAELKTQLQRAAVQKGAALIEGARATGFDATPRTGVVRVAYQGSTHVVTADLVAIADGAAAGFGMRERDYAQHAITANVQAQVAPRGVAYERFTAEGPIALLPRREDWALIWTCGVSGAEALRGLDDQAFLARLHARFGDRLGKFIHAGPRASFPLRLRYAAPSHARRTVLLGAAAQALHPVAAQGFNLGLRDAFELAAEIASRDRAEIGAPETLSSYRRRRAIDRGAGVAFTDSLVRLFSNDFFRFARGLGLTALDSLPPVKRAFMQHTIFGF